MKILWMSNRVFSDRQLRGTGTWLHETAKRLSATGEVELCNIAMGKVQIPVRQDVGTIQQWVVPYEKPGRNGLPSRKVLSCILRIIETYSPDLVSAWGTEYFWGLLTARALAPYPALLEMQGLKEPYARVYLGGLTDREQRSCIGLKEIIQGTGLASGQKAFQRWSCFEREIINGHRFITTQSPWVEAWVRTENPLAKTFGKELILRELFYTAQPWSFQKKQAIFCSAAYPVPYKGIHDAVRALALLTRRFPETRLRIAGALQASGLRQNGYIAWVMRMAAGLKVSKQIDWLGPLSANEIVTELQNCAVMLMPSHCETYGLALAEGLYLGVPVVSAHTGGADWLARDEDSALFFSPGDEVMCAYQLERVLADRGLAQKLSLNSRAAAINRNDPGTILKKQLEIYREVINKTQKSH